MPVYECEDFATMCRYQGQYMNLKYVQLCVDAKASIWIEFEVCLTLCIYQGQYMNVKSVKLYVDIKASIYMNVKSVQTL